MRNIRTFALLALAVLAGLAAALYAVRWLNMRAANGTTQVVVAATDIELGSKLSGPMLRVVSWPSGSLPEGAFTEAAQLQDRVLKVGVVRGDPVVERKLSPAGAPGGLAAVIAPGKRAMTVRVNDVVGVAGFALPGTYVDIVVNMQEDRGRNETPDPVSVTVLEQVLVLAVAQESAREDSKPRVVSAVTLEVAPAEAEKLDLARSVGTLSLVLRNQLDKGAATTTGISRAELLQAYARRTQVMGAPAAPAAPAVMPVAAPAPRPIAKPKFTPVSSAVCVEIVRDGRRATDCF
jgi:pilus assembly protein CpaB